MNEKDKPPSPEPMEEKSTGEVNNDLNELALEAQRYSPGSREQQQSMTRLLSELRKPKRLSEPKRSPGLCAAEYSQVSEDTKQETDLAIVKFVKNGKFDPKKGDIIKFGNRTQAKKQIDAYNFQKGIHKRTENGKKIKEFVVSADIPISNSQSGDAEDQKTTYLEQFTYNTPEPSFLDIFREIVVENPENIFNKSMRNRPDVTLPKITLLWLDEYKWEEIGKEFSVKVGAISSFFNRGIKDEELVAKVKFYLTQFLLILAILLNYRDTN